MKKLNRSLALFVVLFIAFGCSKDSSSSSGCSFSKSTFENKTYKISYLKVDSMGVDVSAKYLPMITGPCNDNTYTLNADGTVNGTIASNCIGSKFSKTWGASTTNGKNYMTSDTTTKEVIDFDCNSFTMKSPLGTNLSLTFKYLKI